MPGRPHPYGVPRKAGFTVVVRCPHDFEWRVDLRDIKGKLVDDCVMAQMEREVEQASKNLRKLSRRHKQDSAMGDDDLGHDST